LKKSDFILTLAVLHFSNGRINGRKRFQKIVCILKHLYQIPFSFRFRMYYYGPYSKELAEALRLLKAVRLINEEVEIGDVIQYNYEITDIAENYLKNIILTNAEYKLWLEKIEEGVNKLAKLPTRMLVTLSKKSLLKPLYPFKFYLSDNEYSGKSAHSLEEFLDIIKNIDIKSLEYHLYRGDFEKWSFSALSDDALTVRIRRLREKKLRGEILRDYLHNIFSTRLEELKSLIF